MKKTEPSAMCRNAEFVVHELISVGSPEKAVFLQRFFKTGKGEYGEGDVFLGVVVPNVRNVARANRQLALPEIGLLLENEYHEARLCGLLILVEQFSKAPENERKAIFDFYVSHAPRVNSWDLVDLSCPAIVGGYLAGKDRAILYRLAESDVLWEQRIAIVSTLAFIRKNEFHDTLKLSKKLLNNKHDLMHKAVGWMLREVGKRDRPLLTDFLESHAATMPRTALRYAIEHYPEPERQYFLKKKRIISQASAVRPTT